MWILSKRKQAKLKTKAQILFLTTLEVTKFLKFFKIGRVHAEATWKGAENSGK